MVDAEDTMPSVTHLGVVVPARNEEALLGRCLASVIAALAAAGDGVRSTVVVVADACTDATASVARAHDVTLVVVDVHSVGAARAAGNRWLLDHWRDVSPDRIWIAHTDADGTVPDSWVRAQLTAAGRHDAFVGTVDLEPGPGDSRIRRWSSAYRAGGSEREHGGHGHVHGANLGFSAAAYLGIGGFEPLEVDEDRALVRALLANGARVAWVADTPVVTSSRIVGRVVGGFASYLQRLQDPA